MNLVTGGMKQKQIAIKNIVQFTIAEQFVLPLKIVSVLDPPLCLQVVTCMHKKILIVLFVVFFFGKRDTEFDDN
jgi:hypothetical protein